MAILNATQLEDIRRHAERVIAVTYTKAKANAAAQAVEDWFEANRAALRAAMEAAAPGVFTTQQKQTIVKFWLQQKAGRE